MAKSIQKTIIVVAAAFALYVLSIVFLPGVFTDIIAPVCDLLAAGIIFYAVFTSENTEFRLNFILTGAAVLSWALADIGWLICSRVLRIDPDNVGIITVLYFGTNLFLVAATIHYLVYRMKKWDTVQLIIDAVTFSLAILWLLWVLMMDKSTDMIRVFLNDSVIGSASILIDVFLIIIIGIWYLSIRRGYIPLFLRFLAGAVCIFSVIDLAYYYMYAHDLYIADSSIDALYLLSLFGLAGSIKMYYVRYPSVYDNKNPNTNIGHQRKGLVIAVCPIIILIFVGLDATDIVFYFLLILIHEAASSYIQKTLRNKDLLAQELLNNQKLEKLVSEKTRDLQAANKELLRKNKELKYAALHDPLTGLHNRTYFMEKLDEFIGSAVSSNEKITLLIWNIDNLKGINDTYRHNTGDQLLIWHAKNVKKLYEDTGVLARLSGDEFALLHKGDIPQTEPIRIAELVVQSCKEPFRINEYTISVSVSVGMCQYPTCSSDRSALLNHADVAMHNAKKTKPDSHISMYSEIDVAMQRKFRIGNYLKAADYDRDLRLYFQPQFRTTDRALIGMEELLRWDCPGIGPVSPAEFIPIAEDENLIIPIGNWVIEHAVRQIAVWNRTYRSNFRMGINFSPKQFNQPSTYEALDASIKRHKAAAEWIDIEITEGVALDSEDRPGDIKRHFRNRGISVSIDDFGTGYSSMGYLSILAFDRLKIAKPLIDKITTDESSLKIVTSIILLAKSLVLQTIAEGVETKEQFFLLQELGCDQIQGYYLGRPLPAGEFEKAFLRSAAG
jgi:diguanylate cyclase (GGDEF)-like protein